MWLYNETMTICVLGVDAADYALAKHWNCNNLLLNSSRSLETESYSLDVPATIEVWPSIATGLHPTDHGVLLEPAERSTNSVMWRAMIETVNLLPKSIQDTFRNWKEQIFGSSLPTTKSSHVFEQGSVTNWPGITPCYDWQRGIDYFENFKDGKISDGEYYRHEIGNAGKGIGWLASQAQYNAPIAGVHIHILDTAGHIYANRPNRLREIYEDIDSMIGWLQNFADDIVIISDHGMQTTLTDDTEPGIHSYRAFFATTMSVPNSLPTSIYDVRGWLEEQMELTDNSQDDSNEAIVDAPIEHLRDLGYFS